MSALSPAPAPTSGVRWTDLPTPLESALPTCYLSYKQSAFLSPLCFHNLTNCFSRKSPVLIIIRIARGCAASGNSHSRPLRLCVSGAQWQTTYFQALTSFAASVSVGSLGVDPMIDMRLQEAQRDGALL